MMQVIDPVRFAAFVELLALPDPADLPHRGHVWRWAGEPDRRHTRLPGILTSWLQHRHLAVDEEEARAPAFRSPQLVSDARYRGLRILRPTGT